MTNKRSIFLFCILSWLSLSAFVIEDDPISALLKKLEEFTKKYPQEKVYLQLDKPYYAIGDDIWFKAYVVDGKTSAPTPISNILYVELINEKDSLTKQLKLPMASGIVWGDFNLPDSLAEGNYRIRAYTQWMRNSGPNFFFDKTIKIGNGWNNKVFANANNVYTNESNIEKVKSTIKFTDKNGKPYPNAAVNFETQLANKLNSKGNIVTNTNGEIIIELINKEPQVEKTGSIKANITMADGSKVTKTIPVNAFSSTTDVQFFPEGGKLIENLPCKVAFKSINNNGLGENISGIIIDEQGAEVLKFESTYLGMGSFSLTPMAQKTYSAKVKFANGLEKTMQLPLVENSGYIISVNNTDSTKMAVKVMLSENLLNKGELALVAQHNGNVLASTKIPTSKQISSAILPKATFPSGIIRLTLFSPDNLPVSERMAFVNNLSDKIDVNLENLKSAYEKKGNVKFDVSASNNKTPTQGSFSIAVTNTKIIELDQDSESNILTGLLLTADVKGFVERPNHYFLKNDIQTNIELDHLMLTQAWRKIDWKGLNTLATVTNNFLPEKSMNISGLVTTNGKKPIANGKITLLSTTKSKILANTTTDENGRFSFDEVSFGDSIKFVLQGSTKDGNKNVRITLDKYPEQTIGRNPNNGDVEVNVNASIMSYLIASNDYFDEQYKKGFLNRTNQLKTVNIVQKVTKEDKASANSSNLNGRGRANHIITAEDLKNATSLAQYLQGRVPGVAISNEEDTRGQPILTRPRPVDTVLPIMAVSLDGMVLRDFSLDNVEVPDVESIEIITDVSLSAIYGQDGYNGVIVITTKQGKGRKMSEINAPGIVVFSPKGFDVARQFYSPKYDAKNPDKNPDLRTTVYWNPNIVTDAAGKSTIDYYNTDQAGIYRIVIEGIDADGNLARKVVTYQVN